MAEKSKAHIYNSALNMWLSFLRRVGPKEFVMLFVRMLAANRIIPRLPRRTFFFEGTALDYFYAKYNLTWVTERALEVPIGFHCVRQAGPRQTLEVGNVLGHYIKPEHTVLDKFERGEGIINADILEYQPGRVYDLIISLSTFEHIGYEDDGDPDAEKIRSAIIACQRLLSPGGRLVITVPFGYNPYLDTYIAEDRIKPDKVTYYEKVSNFDWKETGKAEALNRKYAKPFSFANAIMVAEFGRLGTA